VVQARLAARGADPSEPDGAWQYRRAAECCAAHEAAHFATHIPTGSRGVGRVIDDLVEEIERQREIWS